MHRQDATVIELQLEALAGFDVTLPCARGRNHGVSD
jgi:hypothetical protein